MTIKEALADGFNLLAFYHYVSTPYLDAVVLLSEALGITKEKLYLSFPDILNNKTLERYKDFLSKRSKGIPVSYILGRKEFYGLEFKVNPDVLVPRPETECLVEKTASIIKKQKKKVTILDVGTGTGCIAICLKKEFPFLHIVASDISPNVCSIFQENNRRLVKYHIPFILSDLFKKIGNRYNIIVSNPPYLKDKTVDKMKSRGWPEPESALRGGKEGLSIIYRLISQSVDHLKPDGYLLMEAESIQMKKIERKMVECGFKDIQVFKDLSGLSRVIGGRK